MSQKGEVSCSIDHNHSSMASEIFLQFFRACFDALYDASNESGLRWWINENIRDFIAPTFIHSMRVRYGMKDTTRRYSCG